MNIHPELQRRRAPEPERPFVNRQDELRLVKSKLDMGVKGKPMPSVVLCFWGAFGMGKSWLLIKLKCRYRYTNAQRHGSHPTIAARLDLNKKILHYYCRTHYHTHNILDLLYLHKQLLSFLI